MTQSGALFLGLTAIVAALAGILAFALAKFISAARDVGKNAAAGGEAAFMAARAMAGPPLDSSRATTPPSPAWPIHTSSVLAPSTPRAASSSADRRFPAGEATIMKLGTTAGARGVAAIARSTG